VARLDFFSRLSDPVLVNELVCIPGGVSLRKAAGDWIGDAS